MDPAEQLPCVRVVVLNWCSAWLTARCLRSLAATDYPADRLEVVVVDNASIDGSAQRLRHDQPMLRFLENPANLGFAEGCNRAMRDLLGRGAAPVDHVALVNSDAVVDPGWLRPLVAALEADPGLGAVSPKLLLETPFADIAVDPEVAIEAVEVDGVDATGRCLRHRLAEGRLGVPLPAAHPVEVELRLEGGAVVAQWIDPADATVRINSVGLSMTPQSEGLERLLGEDDRDDLTLVEVEGCTGGAVLYRVDALRRVGLFDPRFFAYNEDLDLSWRLRRAGWRLAAEPASVVLHLMWGSGGPASDLFFFVYFRNWLTMVLRNGDLGAIAAAFRNAAGRTWSSVRRGPRDARHRGLLRRWGRVWAGVGVLAPRTVAGRLTRRRPGRRRPRRLAAVRGSLLPDTRPPPPRPRPGGPTIVYLDTSAQLDDAAPSTMARVVHELVVALPRAAPDLELVPVVWSPARSRFRRVTSAEYSQLLAGHRDPSALLLPGPAPRSSPHPQEEAALVLDRLEPGAVFVDPDPGGTGASAARPTFVAEAALDGVRMIPLFADTVALEHPEWVPDDVARSRALALVAHARHAEVVLVPTDDVANRVVDQATARAGVAPPAVVAPFGSTLGVDAREPLPPVLEGVPYLLVVGAIEHRRGHDLVLDAWGELVGRHAELHLVLVGREGTGAGELVDRVRRLASVDARVHWFHAAADPLLAALYHHALVVVAPSRASGFELPVVEALAEGAAVVAADLPTVRQAGGEGPDYVAPGDLAALVGVLGHHLDDPAHRVAARARAEAVHPRPWWDFVCDVAAAARRSDP